MAVPKAAGRRGLWLSLMFFCLVLGVGWFYLASGKMPAVRVEHLFRQMGGPLARLLLYLAVGLLAAQILESLGWAARLGKLAAPLLRWGGLREESGASFTAACFSGLLANTMLMTFYQEGKLSRQEMMA
ncbi:MAG: nucleoside recognition domain-containing protein, partial [Desulfobaccales bacterium]